MSVKADLDETNIDFGYIVFVGNNYMMDQIYKWYEKKIYLTIHV